MYWKEGSKQFTWKTLHLPHTALPRYRQNVDVAGATGSARDKDHTAIKHSRVLRLADEGCRSRSAHVIEDDAGSSRRGAQLCEYGRDAHLSLQGFMSLAYLSTSHEVDRPEQCVETCLNDQRKSCLTYHTYVVQS